MKVFISWSGDRSREVALLLKRWFERNVQSAEMWISTDNIGAGVVWFEKIKNSLDETSVGIVCLTKTNVNNPWILFEAGVLAKGTKDNKVCTLLIDMAPSDLHPPLSQFNATALEKTAFKKLVSTINEGLEKPLLDAVLEDILDSTWDKLYDDISDVVERTNDGPAPPRVSIDEALSEIGRLVSQGNQAIARQQSDITALTEAMQRVTRRVSPELALKDYFAAQDDPIRDESLREKLYLERFMEARSDSLQSSNRRAALDLAKLGKKNRPPSGDK